MTGSKMRKVIITASVLGKIAELRLFLTQEHKMSRTATNARIDRIRVFLTGLSASADYALCRFERWRALGYRCISFEGWVFAYEVAPEGVIVQDMSHAKMLADAAD